MYRVKKVELRGYTLRQKAIYCVIRSSHSFSSRFLPKNLMESKQNTVAELKKIIIRLEYLERNEKKVKAII